MFAKVRNRPAPKKHVYVERPAYIITERELAELEDYIHRLEVSRRTLLRDHDFRTPQRFWPGR